ncbi:MAG TPA: hypothetical protein VK071_06790 [Tissierellales bacterium]|nr:hypothetical protein [Tissierellales bacterium]
MWRVISRNRENREREKELLEEIQEKNEDDPYEFTRLDILAMIIAAFQLMLPIVIGGILIFAAFTFIFTNFIMR